MSVRQTNAGFTLIELIVVIIIVGILSAIFIPSYWNISRQARIATLEGVQGAMRSAIAVTRSAAYTQGVRVNPDNPGGGNAQNINLVQMEGLLVEVDWRNLCPESIPELGDAKTNKTLSMLDFLALEPNPWGVTPVADGELYTYVDNIYTLVGYDIKTKVTDTGGCFVRYNSFGKPDCTVELVITDC